MKKRQTKFIDRPVQGKLLFRVIGYWALCMIGMYGILAAVPITLSWFVVSEGAPTSSQLMLHTLRIFWPALFASSLILPLLLLDVLRVSHRFAGPMYRLRNALRDLADGKPVAPIQFRDGDYWCEMADEFNRLAVKLRDLDPVSTREAASANAATKSAPNSVAL